MKYDCENCGKNRIVNRILKSFEPNTLLNLSLAVIGKKLVIKTTGENFELIGYVDADYCPFCGKRLKED